MSAQHMVEHLILAVQSSNGNFILNEFITPPEKLNVMKRFLLSNRPLPKNFTNTIIGEGLKPLIYSNLEIAKHKLLEEINNFEEYFKKNSEAKPINATFGPLNYKEWIAFHNKHFTHHLTQFGLI
jgi:oxepin-CoA hydrolase/3-oxo-5,6-dehydrosuberyl-CoA semialdehyde dehydrogenase